MEDEGGHRTSESRSRAEDDEPEPEASARLSRISCCASTDSVLLRLGLVKC